MYPPNWPRCVRCDDFAMDGHLTCGRAECDESKARDERSSRRFEVWSIDPKEETLFVSAYVVDDESSAREPA